MIWLTRKARLRHVDVRASEKAIMEALNRRARTREVLIGTAMARAQNHYTSDLETIMEGRR